MPTLAELLDDASIADELEVSFGDKGKFKVADLRSQRKTQAANEQKLAEILLKAAQDGATAESLAKEAEKLLAKAKEPAKSASNDIDFDTDPLYSPLVSKLIKPLQEQVTGYKAVLEALQKSQIEMGTLGLKDIYRRRWNEIPADKRGSRKWQDYVKIANERHIVDPDLGVPDPVAALYAELEPGERSAVEKERDTLKAKVEELTKQVESNVRMPRPGAAGTPPGLKKDDKVFDSTDSLVDAAFSDPLIQSITGVA